MTVSHRLMLLDTASLYFRAFFGVPDSVRSPRGEPINAVRGLLDFMSRLISEYNPTDVVCCWDDNWRPTWRVALVPSYKEHRVVVPATGTEPDIEEVPEGLQAQIPVMRQILDALGVPVVGAHDHEADDVIGTFATQAEGAVDVVTGDRDLFQLVDDEREIRVLYTARGVSKHERVTDLVLKDKYGVIGAQYADFAMLRGDASDGLPGVAGIGEKTAATLLQRYGSLLDMLQAAIDQRVEFPPGPRAKLLSSLGYLAVAPHVVNVVRDLDLPTVQTDISLVPMNPERLDHLAQRWGLTSSLNRLIEAATQSSNAE